MSCRQATALAIGAAALWAGSIPSACSTAWAKPRPAAPAAPAPAPVAMTAERAAVLGAEPTVVAMPQSEVGWIKGCPVAAQPKDCSVSGGFALKPNSPPNLQLVFGLQSANGTRKLSVMLPLEVELRAGFTVALDSGQAVLGDYTSCSAIGCSGQVGLSNAEYDQLLRAKKLGLLIGNSTDRALRLDISLAGLAATAAGPAMSIEEMSKRRDAAAAKWKAAASGTQAATAKP